MSSNLPPGVTASMIPGNRPGDDDEEAFFEVLYADLTTERVDAIEADESLPRIIIKARDLGYEAGYNAGRADAELEKFMAEEPEGER